jgi:hypothetical protein
MRHTRISRLGAATFDRIDGKIAAIVGDDRPGDCQSQARTAVIGKDRCWEGVIGSIGYNWS